MYGEIVDSSLLRHLVRLQEAQAVGRTGSWEFDAVTNTVTWSAELYRIHGLEVGADLTVHDRGLALVHPDDRERVRATVDGGIADGTTTWVEYRIVRPDGKVRHLHGRTEARYDAAGKPVVVTGTAVDVTEFVAERALAAARADFRTLIDELLIGVVINRDGTWIHVNRAFASMLGYEARELAGHSPFEFLHPDDHVEAGERMRAFLRRNMEVHSIERRFRRRDGQEVVVEVTPRHLVDFEGSPAVLLLMRNVTEDRRRLRQQLIAERMVSVGTLAAGVAHEINNPLAYVMSNLDLLAEELRSLRDMVAPERLRDLEALVGDARGGAERVRKVVRGLRTLSRGDEETRSQVELSRVIDAALAIADNEIRHRARLTKHYGSVPPVLADEGRLTQVFINLVVNAAQAIREGQVDRNEIVVSTRVDARGNVVAEVRDTGHGIREDVLPRLFDPFFTTKEVGAGSGLGLSICHGIVTGLGGTIEVETEVGKGSCFRIVLPAARPEGSAGPSARASASGPSAGCARVLLVDDDSTLRRSFRRALRHHDVVEAETGRAALEILRRDASFDVILCDVMMPQMTGIDLYGELASSLPEVLERIVFMTGGAFTPEARRFLEELPNECLEKPLDVHKLRAAVDAKLAAARRRP